MATRPTKFHCDRVRGLNVREIQEGFGRTTQAFPIVMGREQVFPTGTNAPVFTIDGTISEATFAQSAAKAAQLIELVENAEGYPFLYFQFPGYENTMNGFYSVESLALPRSREGILVYPFQLTARRIGTLTDSRIALYWSATSETYSGWSSLTATTMVALPNGATNVAHTVAGTRTANNGTNQYIENPTRNTMTFKSSATIEDWFKAECAVYDTIAPGETNRASWRQVFHPNHVFAGDIAITNGLWIYQIGSTCNTYFYESVTSNLFSWLGKFETYLTGDLNATLVSAEITKITTEIIEWREVRQNSSSVLTAAFSLRRGAPFIRVNLKTYATGANGVYYFRYNTGTYNQIFNSTANGAVAAGNLALDTSSHYACGYNTTTDLVSGFALLSQPTYQPPDPATTDGPLATGLTMAAQDSATFFLIAFAQETSAFNLTTGRSNAAAIAAHTLKNIDVKQILVPKAFYA